MNRRETDDGGQHLPLFHPYAPAEVMSFTRLRLSLRSTPTLEISTSITSPGFIHRACRCRKLKLDNIDDVVRRELD